MNKCIAMVLALLMVGGMGLFADGPALEGDSAAVSFTGELHFPSVDGAGSQIPFGSNAFSFNGNSDDLQAVSALSVSSLSWGQENLSPFAASRSSRQASQGKVSGWAIVGIVAGVVLLGAGIAIFIGGTTSTTN